MKVLLVGCNGQIGRALAPLLGSLGELVAADRSTMDLAAPDSLPVQIRRHRPGLIVNAAAYTAVDRAEREPALAHRVNSEAVAVMADEARRLGALLVHYSTDYVFDGSARRPYVEDDAAAPLSVYGASKLAGEQALAASGARHLILRTSGVYAQAGSNFVLTMLRLARERPELRVVDDQAVAPTWAADVATATLAALRAPAPVQGLYHVTSAGRTTWCGFAREILRLAGLATPVVPISTAEYAASRDGIAPRPAWSLLDCGRFAAAAGWRIGPWNERLAAFAREAGLQAGKAT